MAPLSTSPQKESPDHNQAMASTSDSTMEDKIRNRVLHSENNNNMSSDLHSSMKDKSEDLDVKTEDWDVRSEEVSNMSSPKGSLPIRWKHVMELFVLHVAAIYGGYLMVTSAKWQTSLFAVVMYQVSGLGVTAGAHRLWCHRSYKAKLPLRALLAFLFTMAFQWDIYVWVRNHRVHHKYSETDADPHNANRGFFFSHIGWIMSRKHPDVIAKGQTIDFSDLLADPVVRFQRRYYPLLVLICCFALPTLVPMYCWGETLANAFFIAATWRHIILLHQTFLVNSAAHMWGNRPYDVNISPTENVLVTLGAMGEGFHNYHHTFPYDYATSEYGMKYNITTFFIDAMALIGQAYDRKTVPKNVVQERKLRTGHGKQV